MRPRLQRFPPGTMPGRYEPQGSAWPQVRTVALLSEQLGQPVYAHWPTLDSGRVIHILHQASHILHYAPSSHAMPSLKIMWAWDIMHGALDLCSQLHSCGYVGSAQWPHPTACTG